VASPWIDRLSAEPGPGWERVEHPPSTLQNALLVILHRGNAEEALMASSGPKALTGGV
jgi:hypothetical protein